MIITRRQLGTYGLALAANIATIPPSFANQTDTFADILSHAKVDLNLSAEFRREINRRFWLHAQDIRSFLDVGIRSSATPLGLFKVISRIWDCDRSEEQYPIQAIGNADARLEMFDRPTAAMRYGHVFRNFDGIWHGTSRLGVRIFWKSGKRIVHVEGFDADVDDHTRREIAQAVAALRPIRTRRDEDRASDFIEKQVQWTEANIPRSLRQLFADLVAAIPNSASERSLDIGEDTPLIISEVASQKVILCTIAPNMSLDEQGFRFLIDGGFRERGINYERTFSARTREEIGKYADFVLAALSAVFSYSLLENTPTVV